MENLEENKETITKEVVIDTQPPEGLEPKDPHPKKKPISLFGNTDDLAEYKERRASKEREVVHQNINDNKEEERDDYQPPVTESSITDEDRAAAKLFFFGFDDTTAKVFAMNVYGNWDTSTQFRTYKNLDSPEYKDLIDCAAIVYKKWKFRWGPEIVIGFSLTTNLWLKYQLASTLKKQMHTQGGPQNNPNNGRIVNMQNQQQQAKNKQTKSALL